MSDYDDKWSLIMAAVNAGKPCEDCPNHEHGDQGATESPELAVEPSAAPPEVVAKPKAKRPAQSRTATKAKP